MKAAPRPFGDKREPSTAAFHFTAKTEERRVGTTILSLLMGLVFGFSMSKGTVHIPAVIRGQFLFAENKMLSMFLAAAGTSAIVVAVMKLLVQSQERREAFKEYSTSLQRGVLSLVVGGVVLGFGMSLSGSCPGTVWIQGGAFVSNALHVWAGGLTGALLFAYAHPLLEQSGLFGVGLSFIRRHATLPDSRGVTGFLVGAALWSVVAIAHLLDPPQLAQTGGNVFTRISWHPAMAGLLVGLLEIPAVLFWKELIGSSQSYVTIASNVLGVFGEKSNAYLRRYRSGIDNFLQVWFMAGAIAGALLATFLAFGFHFPSIASPAHGFESFLGGAFLVIGARTAAGCTSGHGISGMGSLAVGSFIATAGMFAGAIGLSVIRHILHV